MIDFAKPSKDINIERQKLIDASQLHGIHWLVLALSAVLTLGAWYLANEQHNKNIAERFQRESLQVIELVKERMLVYENALWGAVAHIDANGNAPNNRQWQRYSNSLQLEKKYPSINGIGIIFNIQREQQDSFIRAQQVDRPNFTIHPQHNEAELWPITYIEPVLSNQQAVGLDVAFENNRYSAIKQARDTGLAQLTGPITLVQDAKKTPGFLFYAPFYNNLLIEDTVAARRQAITGVSYAPFIMYKLISGTLAVDRRHVTIEITDNGQHLYHDKDNQDADMIDPKPLFKDKFKVNLYGRVWEFNISSNLEFRADSASNKPYFILIAGVIINLLLFALFSFLSKANQQALAYADRVTRELKINSQRLKKSNQDLEQFAYVASHDLKSPLNAIRKLVGWLNEDCEDILPDSSKEHLALLNNRSERMNNLLDDLLDYSRIGRKDHQANEFDLAEIAQAIFNLLDHPANFTLSVEKQTICLPQIPFEIILRNVLSNAIKHHDKASGHIKIRYQMDPGMHHISIEDDGPGIPSELFDKALEMFQTLQPRDKVEGSGMGLALSKKTVEHYGGSLTINSDGINGTTIVILWPIANNAKQNA
ncbi:His Kinase A (phospho-acceptor) domain-containing protein [Colwellia chukchiensis]|uniref:histidine kinase n=1 Tax=Colwellia chukchiensis TaxID=641665 RepID=A0A1H7NVJ8_9GAMM|nr:CHASE domain-containing protein [Colwellia chukchiensis]SEL27284.1 His Kinase A (phospho-acceptor) domain-containing protein [Colwellia chukchiensis]